MFCISHLDNQSRFVVISTMGMYVANDHCIKAYLTA